MKKLFAGSLPYNITDESLLQLFTEKGYKPVSAGVIADRDTGRSRGYGFVELGRKMMRQTPLQNSTVWILESRT